MGRSKKVDDKDILKAIAVCPDPVVTAPELAEQIDYSVDGMRNRLRELEDDGLVKSRGVGARAVIWWLTTDGREYLSQS